MDFYTILKPEVENRAGVFAEQVLRCNKKITKTEQRLRDEKALLIRLRQQKEKLTGLSDESLVDSDNSYEKFKTSLRKLAVQIESTEAAIGTLEGKILSDLQKEMQESEQKLKNVLHDFCIQHKSDCEVEMTELLDRLVALQDDYFTAFDRFYADYALLFVIHDIALYPLPQHARISDLSISGRSAEQRAAAMKAATQAVAPEVAQNEPAQAVSELVGTPQSVQDGQTPVEPIADTHLETPDSVVEPDGDVVAPEAEPEPVSARQRASGAIPTEQTASDTPGIPTPERSPVCEAI